MLEISNAHFGLRVSLVHFRAWLHLYFQLSVFTCHDEIIRLWCFYLHNLVLTNDITTGDLGPQQLSITLLLSHNATVDEVCSDHLGTPT